MDPRPPPSAPRKRTEELRARAVEMAARGLGNREIGAELNVDRKTVEDWRKEPAFAAAVAATHNELVEHAKNKSKHLVTKAIDKLEGLLDRADEAPTQLKAAELVLKTAGVLDSSVEVRVSTVEEAERRLRAAGILK